MGSQISLDFSRFHPAFQDGKKEQRIPTAVSQELKEFVELMARIQGTTVSEMTHRYIVDGLKNDLAKIFMPEPHLDKSLRDVLAKF
ncbi:MAG: hypothetical protein JW902_03625 [Syntrophaceae bacterium]|nr:hypothetical protein [Syntrophaceae bacterium]